MNISLAIFAKNEGHCIVNAIDSVYNFVDEVVILDTGSSDNTIDQLSKYKYLRVYKVGFTDFGSIRTVASHLCRADWILGLDCDETLTNPHLLTPLIRSGNGDAYALPRKRWLDLEMTKQTELEAYPDWQVRLYRNKPEYTWKRELHEYFDGTAVHNIDLETNPLVINHFQDVFKDYKKKIERYNLYKTLAEKAKVNIDGGKPMEEKKEEVPSVT